MKPLASTLVLVVASLAALVTLVALGLGLGSVALAPDRVWAALIGQGSPREAFLVAELRAPRVWGALAAGAALAWSGLLFQGLVRNPLVSPDLVGIESGAALGAVFVIVAGLPSEALAWGAWLGAGLTAALVLALAAPRPWEGSRLLFTGLGLNALAAAGVSLLLVRANVFQASVAYHWMVGSLASVTSAEVGGLVLALVVLGIPALALTPGLRLLQTGEPVARSLGAPVGLWRGLLTLAACGLAASAVAVVGPIGFLALAVPHAARAWFGPIGPASFGAAGLWGGLLLLAVDLAGQHLVPGHLPAGLLVAALGGPYFLTLLRRRAPVL